MTSSSERASTPGLPSLLMVTGRPVAVTARTNAAAGRACRPMAAVDDCLANWQRDSLCLWLASFSG